MPTARTGRQACSKGFQCRYAVLSLSVVFVRNENVWCQLLVKFEVLEYFLVLSHGNLDSPFPILHSRA